MAGIHTHTLLAGKRGSADNTPAWAALLYHLMRGIFITKVGAHNIDGENLVVIFTGSWKTE